MLFRLIFVLVAILVVFTGLKWWRARKLVGSGGLNVVELGALMKLAKRAPRLDAALKLRVLIVETASPNDRRAVAKRIDDAVRRLAKQEELAEKIQTALAGIDREKLAAQIDDALVEAETASDLDEREHQGDRLRGLKTQADHAEKLALRRRDLDAGADRILVELRNLQLAMLDAKSSEAALSSVPVQHALTELEDVSEGLRQEAAADEEVNRLLRSASVQKQAR